MASVKRVAVDTNVWISALISRKFDLLFTAIAGGQIKLIYSSQLLAEIFSVTVRPKMKKYFSQQEVSAISKFISTHGELVSVTSSINICRDPEDNFLLALSIDGNADYLVTFDEDLLVLKNFRNTEIISYTEFKQLLLV